jgi:homoserine acetyltransferase
MADEENAYTFTTAATRHITLTGLPQGGMPMWRGARLAEVTLAYESWGELSAAADNAIIIFTGLSPSAHAASSAEDPSPGWWEYMIGPGKAIDTDRFFVVCANSLGGCYGSTGPGSLNPETGQSYGADFPDLTVEDIASSGYYLMRELGVDKVHAAVGSSMGGMSSIAYAMQYPGEIKYLVSISAATQALPLTIALRSLQREIIRSDPDWNNGRYSEDSKPLSGMSLARKLGLVSYRAADEWNSKFDRSRMPPPNSYLYLSRAMDWFDIAEHGESISDGMSKVDVDKALVVGVTTDILFPARQQKEIADVLRATGTDVDYVEIDSVNGHDAFLIDDEHFSPVVKKFLDQSVT